MDESLRLIGAFTVGIFIAVLSVNIALWKIYDLVKKQNEKR